MSEIKIMLYCDALYNPSALDEDELAFATEIVVNAVVEKSTHGDIKKCVKLCNRSFELEELSPELVVVFNSITMGSIPTIDRGVAEDIYSRLINGHGYDIRIISPGNIYLYVE